MTNGFLHCSGRQVVEHLRSRGLQDSWAAAGRPGREATCRFGTRIDYIMVNEAFQQWWSCTSVRHLSAPASDHSPVVATYREIPQ